MTEQTGFDSFHLIHAYPIEQAIEDGVVIPVSAPSEAEPPPKPLHEITTLDGYLRSFGRSLGKKAVSALDPLHVPNLDPLPEFDDLLREPFDAQKHVIAASVQMLNTTGSGFIVGTMGTGKTLLAMSAAYLHGRQPRSKDGYNGRFRCLVLCPDHLIAKWKREIEETIPGAMVYHFGPLTQEESKDLQRRSKGNALGKKRMSGGQKPALADLIRLLDQGHKGRWAKPQGPEYYVLGRNQCKWYPDWLGITDEYRGFGGRPVRTPLSSRNIVIDRIPIVDDDGRPIVDAKGVAKMQNVTARAYACPCCGTVVRDNKGVPVGAKAISDNQVTCKGRYLQQIPSPEKKTEHGRDRIGPIPLKYGDKSVGTTLNIGDNKYVVKECGEPLWWYTSSPYRWAIARIIQQKFRRYFQYLLIDEVHEQKSDSSGQSLAASKLIGSIRHTIALTGTIIGGYAKDLFALLIRICPETLKQEGFEWGKETPFSRTYGRIDRVVKITEEGASPTKVTKNVRSMRRAKSGKAKEDEYVRPGVMPTLFARHMIGNSIFITLDEMADELPDLFEYIGGNLPEPPELTGNARVDATALDQYERMKAFWVDTACEMEPTQKSEYDRIEATLDFASKELLKRGSMKLLGTMLATTLGLPDYCWSQWGRDDDLAKAFKQAEAQGIQIPYDARHTVGYWEVPGNKHLANWRGVVTPVRLSDAVVYPKEQRIIDICRLHKNAGNQVWVYCEMTQKRNVVPRLKALLEREGFRVGVLRSGDVDPTEREDWIARHGRDFDVMICHPKLVSTGLDLFSKSQGGHNYNCIVFYQTGYKLNDMRQAARRAWRIGQPKDCYIYYLYYKETMQHRAMSLMSRKMAAALALEGEFSEEGLAAMAGDDNMQMALAKSMAEKIDQADMQRSWSKVKSSEKKRVKKPVESIKEIAAPEIRHPAPMPAPAILARLTHAQRQAFKRMALHPDEVLNLGQMKCIGDTADALVEGGLAERVGYGWRCQVSRMALRDVLTWFQLYRLGTRCLLHLGIVKARRPSGPEYYVTCTNHTSLPNTLWVLPVERFPRVNSIPLHAKRAKEEGWVLTQASDVDRATLQAQGFFKAEASPLDSLPLEPHLVGATILERQKKLVPVEAKADIAALAERFAQADAGMWAAARTMAEGEQREAEPLVGTLKVEDSDGDVMFEGENKLVSTGFDAVVEVRAVENSGVEAMIVSPPEPEPKTKRPKLKVHRPEPEPAPQKVFAQVDDIVFDDELIAKMMANMAKHGMTAEDTFG